MLGHPQPLGGRSRIGIGARRLGGDDHADRVGIRLGRADIAARCLGAAAEATEQVGLVADAKPGIDLPVLARRAGQALGRGQAPVIGAGAQAGLGQLVGPGAAQHRAGLLDPRHGDADIGVGGQRVGNEAVEHRIIVEPPPVALDGRGGHRRIGRDEGAGRGLGRRRRDIVRTGGTGGERQGRGGCEEDTVGHFPPLRDGPGAAAGFHSAGCSAGSWPPSSTALRLPRILAMRSPSARQTT